MSGVCICSWCLSVVICVMIITQRITKLSFKIQSTSLHVFKLTFGACMYNKHNSKDLESVTEQGAFIREMIFLFLTFPHSLLNCHSQNVDLICRRQQPDWPIISVTDWPIINQCYCRNFVSKVLLQMICFRIQVLCTGNGAGALLPVRRDSRSDWYQSILLLASKMEAWKSSTPEAFSCPNSSFLSWVESLNHFNVFAYNVYVDMFTGSLNKNQIPFHTSMLSKIYLYYAWWEVTNSSKWFYYHF